eukprot:301499_1
MFKACCGNSHFELTKSSVGHITELFLLYIGDQITDLIVLSQWYIYGYYGWVIMGIIVMSISWIMQWLYCTWNCNSYLQNLLKRRYEKSQNIKYSTFWASSLQKTNINVDNNNNNSKSINDDMNQCWHNKFSVFSCFIFKSLWHLCLNGGIFESYIHNICHYNNKIIGAFIDLINIHVVTESIIMFGITLIFCFKKLNIKK